MSGWQNTLVRAQLPRRAIAVRLLPLLWPRLLWMWCLLLLLVVLPRLWRLRLLLVLLRWRQQRLMLLP